MNSPEVEIKKLNPLLERLSKIPGDTIRLPSRGLFYKNGELDSEVNNGEITLKPMTATDELLMKSPDMLFQGTAVENVIKRCAPQVLKPLKLLTSDVDYILTQLRKISYGAMLPITYDCECQTEHDENNVAKKRKRKLDGSNEYEIPIDHFIRTTKEIDPKDYNSIYTLELSNGQYVRLKPATFEVFIQTQQMESDSLKDTEKLQEFISQTFTHITESIDEVTDTEMIKEWYGVAPIALINEIKDRIPKINDWGAEFKYKIKCNSCNKEVELTTQLNPMYFFILPSSQKTR